MSPDGSRIVFYDDGVYVMGIDGTSVTELTSRGGGGEMAWSPDGQHIAVIGYDFVSAGDYHSGWVSGSVSKLGFEELGGGDPVAMQDDQGNSISCDTVTWR